MLYFLIFLILEVLVYNSQLTLPSFYSAEISPSDFQNFSMLISILRIISHDTLTGVFYEITDSIYTATNIQ